MSVYRVLALQSILFLKQQVPYEPKKGPWREFMHIQYSKEKQTYMDLPPQEKLGDSDDVTEEAVSTSIRRALSSFSNLQAHDGHWPADFGAPMFLLPGLIITLYITGALNTLLSTEHVSEMRRFIYNHQNEDGGWGFHIEGHSTMFGSVLSYVTIRLLGEEAEGGDGAIRKGREWILQHGGATHTTQWGKFWLSVLGVFDWAGNNPLLPEMMLLPQILPFHPSRIWLLTRTAYLPMTYLYAKKFVGAITPTVLSLRRELYSVPYEKINWNQIRNACAKEDLYVKHSLIQDFGWAFLSKVEKIIEFWPFNKLRPKALSTAMQHIHYEDESTRYLCVGPVNKVALLLSQISPDIVGQKMDDKRLYDGVNIILSFMNKNGGFGSYGLQNSYSWLELFNSSETFENIILDHPCIECTSSSIQALVVFQKLYPEHRRDEIEHCVRKAATFIEKMQRPDGSWYGTWGVCFTYGTWFGVSGLISVGRTYSNSICISKACDFLLSKQLSSGGWGESYLSFQNKTYTNLEGDRSHAVNTAWAMLALLEAGQAELNPKPLHRAAKTLINMQMESGEFPQQDIMGASTGNMTMGYAAYRNIFPIWALGEYRTRLSLVGEYPQEI